MPSPKKNRLLEIEKKLKGRQRKARKRLGKSKHRPMAARHKRGGRVRAQALDQGEPIELTYNETTESYESGAMSYEVAGDEEMAAEAFDSDEDKEAEAFDWDEDNEIEAQAFDVDEDDEAAAFEVEAFEEDDDEEESDAPNADNGGGSQAFSAADLDDEDLADDLDFSDLDAAQGRDQPSRALSESDFAADLHAIINGEKTYDRDRGGVVNTNGDDDEEELATAKSQATVEETPPAPDADANPHEVFSQMSQHMPHNRIGDAPLAQAKNQAADAGEEAEERPHDVFDRMGRNMSYANAFDLGSISMEQRFEELDEAIDKEEEKIQARAKSIKKKNGANDQETSAPLALNEAALVDDLDQMHGAMAHEDDEPDEDNESASDHDEPDQAMQLAIDAVAYVTKTDKGGALLHPITTNTAGDITKVKAVQMKEANQTRIPTGGQISVDTGKVHTRNNDEYIWTQYNNKTGAVRKSSVVVLQAAAESATVVRSDVKVTDTGIQEQKGTRLYSITPRVDGSGKLTAFLESGELKTLPLGAEISVQPGTRSSNDDNIWWAMHVNGAQSKFGAVDRGDIVVESQAQNIPIPMPSWGRFFDECWTKPWLKALFRGYLRTIYAAENLDFLSAVAQISNAAQARHVCDLYVELNRFAAAFSSHLPRFSFY